MITSETAAQVTLAVYAGIAAAIIGGQILLYRHSWQAWVLYIVARLYSGLLFHWRSHSRCPFPDEGPALIIANHRSPADPMMIWTNHHLGSHSRRLRIISFLMAKEYYEIRGLHWMFKATQAIPIGRDGRDMGPVKEALARLKNGELVAIFPEGRINLGEGLLEGNPGVAWLALTAKVPVYPVFIHDSPQGESMVEPFCKPSRVTVSYGDTIDFTEFFGERKTQELLKQVTDLMMEHLAELGGVTYRDEKACTGNDDPETLIMRQATG